MSLFLKCFNIVKPNLKSVCNIRSISTNISSNKNALQRLDNRGIIRVSGNEVVPYLQGLLTNDMRHLEEGAGSMYALFLNTRGRVMFDSIIYKTEDPETYLIECDIEIIEVFQKHLKMFRVKKKIDIDQYPLDIWVSFNTSAILNVDYEQVNKMTLPPYTNVPIQNFEKVDDIFIYKDPRINLLGSRLLCKRSNGKDVIIEKVELQDVIDSKENLYKLARYSLGVGEGIDELPPGNCFPLESNADFLHGISFHKGCYIGQELTARTHHTGVVRKRLMPLVFKTDIDQSITDITLPDNDNIIVGKVRGVADRCGLGLIRMAQALVVPYLQAETVEVRTYKPQWWPAEAPKEKAAMQE